MCAQSQCTGGERAITTLLSVAKFTHNEGEWPSYVSPYIKCTTQVATRLLAITSTQSQASYFQCYARHYMMGSEAPPAPTRRRVACFHPQKYFAITSVLCDDIIKEGEFALLRTYCPKLAYWQVTLIVICDIMMVIWAPWHRQCPHAAG